MKKALLIDGDDSYSKFTKTIRNLQLEGDCVEFYRFNDAGKPERMGSTSLKALREIEAALAQSVEKFGGGEWAVWVRDPEDNRLRAQFRRSFSRDAYPGKIKPAKEVAAQTFDFSDFLKQQREDQDRNLSKWLGIATALGPLLLKLMDRPAGPSVTDQIALYNAMGPTAQAKGALDIQTQILELKEIAASAKAAGADEASASITLVCQTLQNLVSPENMAAAGELVAKLRHDEREAARPQLPAPEPRKERKPMSLLNTLQDLLPELIVMAQKGTPAEAAAEHLLQSVPFKNWDELHALAAKPGVVDKLAFFDGRIKMHKQWAQELVDVAVAQIAASKEARTHANGNKH